MYLRSTSGRVHRPGLLHSTSPMPEAAFISAPGLNLLRGYVAALPARRPRTCTRRHVFPFASRDSAPDDYPTSGMAAVPRPPGSPIPDDPSASAGVPSVLPSKPLPPPLEPVPDVASESALVDSSETEEHSEAEEVREDEGPREICRGDFLFSPSLREYREQREAGLISPAIDDRSEWSDAWALAVSPRKALELANQYSRVSILMAHNFADFAPADGCADAFNNASIQDIAMTKARAVYNATGLPAIAEMNDVSIDAPESGSRINKTLQQGYYTRNVDDEADAMIDRVRPISDENRITRFNSAVVYYDGEIEIETRQTVEVAMAFSGQKYATIATTGALDDLYKELTRRFGLKLDSYGGGVSGTDGDDEGEQGKVLVGATLLKQRILRDGKMLNDSIIKVSSFLNHMVDTELMEVCGEELAERLRSTMPNKLLTVESTGLIVGLPTARKLGIPLVFARKSRPITISDSYQTTYRSATKGTTNELIVSCEYLEPGDRVLIVDDFLAGGSTAEALFKLARMAHAKVVGVGVLIEKISDGGRTFLSGYDVPVESLAKILPGGEHGRITFVEEGPWVSPNVKKKDRKQVKEEAVKANAEVYARAAVAAGQGTVVGGEVDAEREDLTDEEDDSDGVDVLSWNDDELDDVEDFLIRDVGRI